MPNKPFKIAFVGTSCVGKTTILNKFKNDPSVALVEEAARKFFEINPKIAARFGRQPQEKIQKLALKLEKEAVKQGTSVILCDRSVIDAVVYVRAYGDKKGSNEMLAKVRDWLPTYDKFYLLDPKGVPYVFDKIRQEDITWRQKLHDAYLDFFKETGIPYEILSGTLEERIEKVRKILPVGSL